MTRRVTIHKSRTTDGELLQVVTIFEPGLSKESIKSMNTYYKHHEVLVFNRYSHKYEYKKA